MSPIEEFSDLSVELAQRRQFMGIRSGAETFTNPDTAEVINDMEAMVREHPEITEFYAGALDRYTGRSEKKLEAQAQADEERKAVLRDRIDIMSDSVVIGNTEVRILNKQQQRAQKEKNESGELIVDEAKIFFKLFRKHIPTEDIPKALKTTKPKPTVQKTEPVMATPVITLPERPTVELPLRQSRTLHHEASDGLAARRAARQARQAAEQEKSDFTDELLTQAHRVFLNVIDEKGSVTRAQMESLFSEKFGLDDKAITKKLVAAAYAAERDQAQSLVVQVTPDNGSKFFTKRSAEASEADQEEAAPSPLGAYFAGSEEEFAHKYGKLKAYDSRAIYYEGGTVWLNEAESKLLDYFTRTGIKQAVSEKSVVAELQRNGLQIDNAELRDAAKLVNKLVGFEVFRTLAPATRHAAKGLRLQKIA